MSKKRGYGFNWSGISQNSDGTYTAQGKVEKRRLLKSLYASGYSVRSNRREDGTWKVVPIGTIRQTKRRGSQVGYRPRTRYIRSSGRYRPVAGGYNRGRMTGAAPRPTFTFPRGSPGGVPAAGSSLYQRLLARQKMKREAEKTRIATQREINEKMKQERIARERQETVSQIRKSELAREALAHERRMQAERMRQNMSHGPGTWQAGAVSVPPKREEPKVDRGLLQAEREREATGE